MKVVTVTNQKGGAGKTSTTLFLASGLARKGNRILLIDLDQQANASFSYHVPYTDDATSLEVLTKQISIKDAIVQAAKNIDLVPASPYLSQLDLKLVGKYDDPQSILKHALQVVSGQYDYVVIDTPPSLNMAVLNALTASQMVIVPTQADIYSLKGLKELAVTVNSVKENSNPGLRILGIVIGRYNARTVFSRAVTDALNNMAAQLNTTVFDTKIREATAVKESQNAFQSIFEYAPKSNVTKDVNNFIEEFLKKEQEK